MRERILVIYPYYNQKKLVETFSIIMNESGLATDAVCFPVLRTHHNSSMQWPFIVELLLRIRRILGNGLISKIYCKVFRVFLIHKIMRLYTHIDFHCYSPDADDLMRWCVKKNITFDIVPWGSDILRANGERISQMKWGFLHCRFIKSSTYLNIYSLYGDIFEEKYRFVNYGCADFFDVDDLQQDEADQIAQELYGDVKRKIVIVCGYNGSKGQNHLDMISAINKLPKEYQNMSHFVFQMTYGSDPDYLKLIKQEIAHSSFSYTILENHLSEKQVAAIRKTAEVVINIQDTDGCAASIRTHLYCKNVLILGEWINYYLLEKSDVYYIKTSRKELTKKIQDVLNNLEKYKKKCEGNREKMNNVSSWERCKNKWIESYGA